MSADARRQTSRSPFCLLVRRASMNVGFPGHFAWPSDSLCGHDALLCDVLLGQAASPIVLRAMGAAFTSPAVSPSHLVSSPSSVSPS